MLRYKPSIRFQGKGVAGTNIFADRTGKRKKRRIRDCEANKTETKKKTVAMKEHTKPDEKTDKSEEIEALNESTNIDEKQDMYEETTAIKECTHIEEHSDINEDTTVMTEQIQIDERQDTLEDANVSEHLNEVTDDTSDDIVDASQVDTVFKVPAFTDTSVTTVCRRFKLIKR